MSRESEDPTIASYYQGVMEDGEDTLSDGAVRRSLIERFKKRLWTCQDGSTVHLSQMTDRHLRNAYRMLKRKGFVSKDAFEFYLKDPGPQGDIAQLAFRLEVDHVLSCRVSPWLDAFEEEIKKRGLREEDRDQ